jgi:hypothetical protein
VALIRPVRLVAPALVRLATARWWKRATAMAAVLGYEARKSNLRQGRPKLGCRWQSCPTDRVLTPALVRSVATTAGMGRRRRMGERYGRERRGPGLALLIVYKLHIYRAGLCRRPKAYFTNTAHTLGNREIHSLTVCVVVFYYF